MKEIVLFNMKIPAMNFTYPIRAINYDQEKAK